MAEIRLTVAENETVEMTTGEARIIEAISPTATVTATEDGAILTVTDKNGTTTAEILNGATGPEGPEGPAGSDGAPGKDGKDGADGAPGQNGTNGTDGTDGVTFTPSVSSAGVISWTNDGERQNPSSVDLVAAVIAALPSAVGVNF